ncbi:MAG TPA: sensor histidine kinase [Bacilli bacterium]
MNVMNLIRNHLLPNLPWFSPKRSIHAKLLILFLFIALIPLILLGMLTYFKSAKVINSQFGDYGQYAVKQLQQQMDSSLKQMDLITGDILSYLVNPALYDYRLGEPNTFSEYIDQRNLRDFIRFHSLPGIKGIFVISPTGYHVGSKNTLEPGVLMEKPWWKAVPDHIQGKYWFGFYESDFYNDQSDPGTSIGLVVPIHERYDLPRGSRIYVEIDAESMLQIFHSYEKDTHSHLKISNGQGETIYQTSGDFKAHDDDVMWEQTVRTTGWRIESRISYLQFYSASGIIRTYTMIVIGISLFLVLVLAYLFSLKIAAPIKKLMKSMHAAGTGNLDIRIKVDSQDELGRLSNRFNSMLIQIQSLVANIRKTETLKKEAELRAFQYQINPHLLFNTLNSIQWKARLSGSKDVEQMLYHLIMVMEGSLNSPEEFITLEEELQVVGHFLKIQQYRYGNVFTCTIDANPSTLPCLIPKMTLQPLLENIFFHSFEDGTGSIRISIEDQGDHLQLLLEDDGKGISQENMASLFKVKERKKGRGGLGLNNVDQKFKLHFGSEYGLSISSELGIKTTVRILWPRKEASDDSGYQSIDY